LAWLVLGGWLLQGVSGAGFGMISYLYYGQFPDLHDTALLALVVKMVCAASGVVLATTYLHRQGRWSESQLALAWNGLIGLGVTALTAAAFLRWFA
jgi:hypothetical protein